MTDHIKREAWFSGVLLAFAVILAGCNKGTTTSPGNNELEPVVYTGKQAPMLEKLDERFQNPSTHFELGQSYRAEGNVTKAKYHFENAIRFDPTHRPAQAALTKVLIDGGEKVEAEVGANRYIARAGYSLEETMRLAGCFEGEGLTDYAVSCYRQAVRKWPEAPDGYRELGLYYMSKGDDEAAKDYLKRSFRLDPTQSEIAGHLGRLGVIVRIPRESEEPG